MAFIQYELKETIGLIKINRPEALNALNSAVLLELNEVLSSIDLEIIRCVVITGAGEKAFVAGADVAEMSAMTESEGAAFGENGNAVFRKIETFPGTDNCSCQWLCPGWRERTGSQLRYTHLQ